MAVELRESAEDYLESILILSRQQEFVRATDICSYFGYSRPTVSIVLKHFREWGFVEVDANNHITLTERGRAIAEDVYTKHELFTNVLLALGVPEEIAREDACKIEHDINPITFDLIREYYESHTDDLNTFAESHK